MLEDGRMPTKGNKMTDEKNNTGSCNTGSCNTGSCNTGSWNTGCCNTGDRNTGSWNTGYRNTGYRNTGSWNTGSWNTGDRNTGCWNTGCCNTGYFNTETPDTVNIFDDPASREEWDNCDKPNFIYFDLAVWISSEDMTEEEKAVNESHGNTGGYLKKLDYKEEFKKSYDKAPQEDRDKIHNIPNFNADKFLEISGIDVRVDSENEAKKAELIAKAEELLYQARKM